MNLHFQVKFLSLLIILLLHLKLTVGLLVYAWLLQTVENKQH